MARRLLRIDPEDDCILRLRLLPCIAKFAELRPAGRRLIARVKHQYYILSSQLDDSVTTLPS